MEEDYEASAVSTGCLCKGRMREKAQERLGRRWREEEKAVITPSQARSHRSGSPGPPGTCSFSPGESQQPGSGTQTGRCPQPHLARLITCGNVWERPLGIKGSVLLGLGVLIICHLSWEEPMVPLLRPRHPGIMSCGVHTVEDGEAVNKMLMTGSWLAGQCEPRGHAEVRGGEDREGQSCPSCSAAAH